MMKIYVLLLIASMTLASHVSQAQDEGISDEDLQKYAIAMDSIDSMKGTLIETISEMVKSNENVSAARYNELSKIIADEAKLAEAEATEEEIEFVNAVADKKTEETAKINEAFQSLARDYIGAKSYNAIKKALASDEEIKAKYDTIKAELAK